MSTIRVEMTEDHLEHLFQVMDSICAAGSENPKDAELALFLARAVSSRGLDSPASDAWLSMGLERYSL